MVEGEAVVDDVLRVHFVGVVAEGSDAIIPGRTRHRLRPRDGLRFGVFYGKSTARGKGPPRSSPAVHHDGSLGHPRGARSVDVKEPVWKNGERCQAGCSQLPEKTPREKVF